MSQTIRITITPEIEKALQILKKSTLGTLNTTELIKLSIGELARIKEKAITQKNKGLIDNDLNLSADELDTVSSRLFHEWAKEDNILDLNNIAHPEKLKPFKPKTYV